MSDNPLQGVQENIESTAGNFTAGINSAVNKVLGKEETAAAPQPEEAAPAPATEEPVAAPEQEGASAETTTEEPDLEAADTGESGHNTGTDTSSTTNRDVDGDGSVDVVHAIVDGEQQVNYLTTDGEVLLTDVDTDGDGTFETTVTSDNITDVTSTDVDNDGNFDTVRYSDSSTGTVFQEDSLTDDGQVYSSRMDFDGDGSTDVELLDENLDGNFEKAGVDIDADGAVDDVYRDVTGDGQFDYVSIDSDGDGILDTNLDAADYGASGIGGASNFEDMGAESTDAPIDDAGMDSTDLF